MTDLGEDRLIAEIARDQVEKIAPEETTIFPLVSRQFFQNSDWTLDAPGGADEYDMLAFGSEVEPELLTPAIIVVTREVVEYVAGEVMESVKTPSSDLINELIKKMFKQFRHEEDAKGEELPSLTREQVRRARELALRTGLQHELSRSQAELLADSLAGSLAMPA